MNHGINAFKHFKINYSKKWIKGKRNNRNQDDRGKKMAKTSIMFYESKWEKNKSADTLQ